MFFLLLFCPLLLCNSQQVLVEQLNTTGIFYEDMGTVQIYRDFLDTNLTLDLAKLIINPFNIAEQSFKSTKQICKDVSELHLASTLLEKNRTRDSWLTNNCDQLLRFIENDMKNIKNLMSNFVKFPENYEKRSKRSLIFEAFPQFIKLVFGTPTEAEMNELKKKVQTIKKISESAGKNLMFTLDDTLNLVKELEADHYQLANKSQKTLDENMKIISEFINNTISEEKILESAIDMNSHINRLTYLVNGLYLKSQSILNMILFVKKGTMYTSLITPRMFLEVLNNNTEEILPNRSLPVELSEENMPVMWSISDLRTQIFNELLYMKIKTPQVRQEKYKLMKVHSLPIIENGAEKRFSTKNKFYLISENNETFIALNSTDSCRTINKTNRVCYMDQITPEDRSLCEVSLYFEDPSKCKWYNLNAEIFAAIDLQNNNWLIVSSRENKYRSICDGRKVHEGELSRGTHKLNLTAGCSFEIDSKIIYSKYSDEANITYHFPEFNDLKIDESKGFFENNIQEFQMSKVSIFSNLKDWDDLSDKFSKPYFEFPTSELMTNEINVWQWIVSASFSSIAVLIICYFIGKIFYNRIENKKFDSKVNTEFILSETKK